jgi:hypothetical protein
VRLPTLLGKKRGHRRTGSQAWGSFGEGLFHAVLVGAGIVFAGLLISGVAVPEWRLNHDFLETRCRIRGTGLLRRTVEDPPGSFVTTWAPALLLRYEADGRTMESWSRARATAFADRTQALERLSGFRIGEQVTGWYDPSDPSTIVLERGFNWWMWLLALLLPGALLGFGGTGLLRALRRWGRSEEAIAASRGFSALLGAPKGPTRDPQTFPGVPSCDDLVNSPGTILRYRLPIESPENWTLLGLGLFAALWNAVVVVFGVGAGLDLLGGRSDRLLLTLLVPFIGVGVAAVVLFVRRLIITTAVGTTQVEVSDHPLRPGGRYDVLLAQAGSGLLRELALELQMEEQATFRQGTDTRTETRSVYRRRVSTWNDLQLDPGRRFEERVAIDIPREAMHSFSSEHNQVRWRLVVRGVPARWPSFLRTFPMVVFPSEAAPAADAQSLANGHPSAREGRS